MQDRVYVIYMYVWMVRMLFKRARGGGGGGGGTFFS